MSVGKIFNVMAQPDTNLLIARILRHLATQSVFKEVSPDVYASNRPSSILDKGQNIDALLSK